MYKVISSYSFEELAEYVRKSDYRLTRPNFESFINSSKRKYPKLKSKISKNKIILKRPRAARRSFQWNFAIKATKQEQGTLLEGKHVIPVDKLVVGIFGFVIVIFLHAFGLLNVDRIHTADQVTDFGKILLLTATCCLGYLILAFYLFGGRLIYRQGEKEVLEYFRTLGTEIETNNSSEIKRKK